MALPSFTFDPLELTPPSLNIRAALTPQPVHLAGKFRAKFLEKLRVHEVCA